MVPLLWSPSVGVLVHGLCWSHRGHLRLPNHEQRPLVDQDSGREVYRGMILNRS